MAEGFESRGTANPLLPAQANAASTGGALGAGPALPRRVPSPECPARVCKTISSIFRLLWQIPAALSSRAHLPRFPHGRVFQPLQGFQLLLAVHFRDKPSETGGDRGRAVGYTDNTHSTPRRSPGLLWLPCGGAFQEGLLFTDFRFNSLALHLSSPGRGARGLIAARRRARLTKSSFGVQWPLAGAVMSRTGAPGLQLLSPGICYHNPRTSSTQRSFIRTNGRRLAGREGRGFLRENRPAKG